MGMSSRRVLLLVFAAAFAMLACADARAQTLEQQLQQVNPGQIQKRLERPQQPTSKPDTLGPPPITAKGQSGPSIKFILRQVIIEGSTVYTPEQIDGFARPLYADSLGKEFTLYQAQQLVDKITAKYRADGYVLSQAILPPQDVTDGVLRIRIVEGFVEHVQFEGDTNESGRNLLQQYAQKLEQTRPMTLAALERYMLLMNDLPGVSATSTVMPSPSTLGSANLLVKIERKAIGASYSIDNRGTPYLGPIQHSAAMALNNLAQLEERTIVRAVTTSPTREMRYYMIQHEEVISDEGTKLSFEANRARVQPGEQLSDLEVEGTSEDYILKLTHPFIRSRSENLTARIAFDYHDSETRILNAKFNEDRLRIARLGLSYDIADDWDGSNLIDVEVSQGTNMFHATDAGPGRSKARGQSDFTKLEANFTRIQQISDRISLLANATGQWSANTLLASEQFILGGPQYGGAYDYSELTGDSGMAARLELRYGEGLSGPVLTGYQLYTYYDIGAVWNRHPNVGASYKDALSSLGFGTRVGLLNWLAADLQVAKPMNHNIVITGNDNARIFFSLSATY